MHRREETADFHLGRSDVPVLAVAAAAEIPEKALRWTVSEEKSRSSATVEVAVAPRKRVQV